MTDEQIRRLRELANLAELVGWGPNASAETTDALPELLDEVERLRARCERLEEVRKAATLNVEKMERITDIDWTETDEYWALRAALDGVKP